MRRGPTTPSRATRLCDAVRPVSSAATTRRPSRDAFAGAAFTRTDDVHSASTTTGQTVEPEDHSPVGDGQDQRPEQRSDDAADLLDRADHAERRSRLPTGHRSATNARVAGDSSAAADTLQETPSDHDRQLGGDRGDGRADDEECQAAQEDALPIDEIRQPTDQRQHRDVPQQKTGDDQRSLLQRIDAEADAVLIMSCSASTTT